MRATVSTGVLLAGGLDPPELGGVGDGAGGLGVGGGVVCVGVVCVGVVGVGVGVVCVGVVCEGVVWVGAVCTGAEPVARLDEVALFGNASAVLSALLLAGAELEPDAPAAGVAQADDEATSWAARLGL